MLLFCHKTVAAIALGIIIFAFAFPIIFQATVGNWGNSQQSIHQGFINLPSLYSNQKIFLDGKDNDWNGIKKIGYSGISTYQLSFR